MRLFRSPLISLITLAVYLAVHVAVRGMHHHDRDAASRPAVGADQHQLQASSTTAGDDENHTCLMCDVLYLAQTHAVSVPVLGVAVPATGIATRATLARPHLMERATRSRAPPSIQAQ